MREAGKQLMPRDIGTTEKIWSCGELAWKFEAKRRI
jgi:hypothetical protein